MGRNVYDYEPKYFKIYDLVSDLKINEDNFTLMNAQHIIAKLSGFDKWTEMSMATPARMELSALLYDNMDRVSVRDWEQYISRVETENKVKLDDEFKLQIFGEVFMEGEQETYYDDYRLLPDEEYVDDEEQIDRTVNSSTVKITSLPLDKDDREEFIKAANQAFERVFERIEPENRK